MLFFFYFIFWNSCVFLLEPVGHVPSFEYHPILDALNSMNIS